MIIYHKKSDLEEQKKALEENRRTIDQWVEMLRANTLEREGTETPET